jgi:hypothetical protein
MLAPCALLIVLLKFINMQIHIITMFGSRYALHVLLLVTILSAALVFADSSDSVVSELAGKTIISPISIQGGNITVRLVYVNLTYYNKLRIDETKINPTVLDPEKITTDQDMNISFVALNNTPLYFKLDGKDVSEGGAAASCNPMVTNDKGEATCRITHFKNQSGGFQVFEERKNCGSVTVEFRGEWLGSQELKPTSQNIVACPSKNSALTAFGPALLSAFSSPSNLPFCIPAIIIAGMLIASMYYSGRDPLSLFDLTTPRLPKAKPARVTGGSTAMSIRTAVSKYREAQRNTKKQSEKLLMGMMGAAGRSNDKKQAKKELRDFFKSLDKDLYGMTLPADHKNHVPVDDKVFNAHRAALAGIFKKYGLDNIKSDEQKRKFYGRYMQFSDAMFNFFVFSEHAMRDMAAARAPAGGRLKKWFDRRIQNGVDASLRMEKSLQEIPGFKKLGPFIPGFAVLGVPHKVLDSIAQRRSAKYWAKYTRRMALGQIVYQATQKKGRERLEAIVGEDTAIGHFAKYMWKWKFHDFEERHDVLNKKISAYRDEVAKYRFLGAEHLNHAAFFIDGLYDLPQLEQFDRLDEKAKTDIRNIISKAKSISLDDPSKARDLLHDARNRLNGLHGEAKDAMKIYVDMLEATVKVTQNKNYYMADLVREVFKAKGEYAKVRSHVAEMRELEDRMRNELGIARLGYDRKNKQNVYGYFDFESLKVLAQQAMGEVEAVRFAQGGTRRTTKASVASERESEAFQHEAAVRLNKKLTEVLFTRGQMHDVIQSTIAEKGALHFLKLAQNNTVQVEVNGTMKPMASQEVFNVIMRPIIGNALSEMHKAIDVHTSDIRSELTGHDILSRFQKSVESINRVLNPHQESIGFSKDPGGIFLRRQIHSALQILGIDTKDEKFGDLANIDDIMAFEVVLARGAGKKALGAALTKAIEDATDEQRRQICKLFELKPNETSSFVEHLQSIVENRNALRNMISRLDEEKIRPLMNALGLSARAGTTEEGKKIKIALTHGERGRIEGEILERLHTVEYKSKRDPTDARKVLAALRMNESELSVLQNSSVMQYLAIRMLKKTFADLEDYGARMLQTGRMMNGRFEFDNPVEHSSLRAKLRTEFRNESELPEAIEYGANRASLLFKQYPGLHGAEIETLYYAARRYNRAVEFAMSEHLGSNLAGNMLGGLTNILRNNLQSFAAQRAVHENLISENSRLYDEKFAAANSGRRLFSFKTPEEREAAASAYLALQSRGLKFKDARHGLAYALSAANEGHVPIIEYNENMIRSVNKKGAGIIIEKDDKRDYGVLLARLNVSEFASDIKGLVGVKDISKGQGPEEKWRRIDPANISEISTLMESAKFHPYLREALLQRNNFALIIAGANATDSHALTPGGEHIKPLMRFVSGTDYVAGLPAVRIPFVSRFVDKAKFGDSRSYHHFMGWVGEQAYAVFGGNVDNLRTWYASQARARHALYTLGAMSGDWLRTGQDRMDAGSYVAKKDVVLVGSRLTDDMKKNLKEAIKTLETNDGYREFLRMNYAKVDASTEKHGARYDKNNMGSAERQDALYAAQLELRAFKKMYSAGAFGALDKDAYKAYVKQLNAEISSRKDEYKQSLKEYRHFTDAVISVTGSHNLGAGTYYGSVRNILTLLGKPFHGMSNQFEFRAGLMPEYSMAIESSAMRAGEINRGGQKGGESWEKMNMNTGQGIYENPRWWATAMYEQSFSPFLTFSHYVHRSFLPLASTFYRMQAGLSSPLQRTELETEFGKPKGRLLTSLPYFLGMKRGMNDMMASTSQEFLDFSGMGGVLAGLRKGNKLTFNSDGTVDVKDSWYATHLQRFGVRSEHVGGSTQIAWQNRIHDRINASKEWQDDGLRGKVQEWASKYEDYSYASGARRGELERELKTLEKDLDPFASKYIVDERQEANKRSIAGNYFNKDGSRDRFMEIFMMDHISTWRPIIPGMTETAPFTGTTLSPQIANYYARAPSDKRISTGKHFYVHEYDEGVGDWIVADKFNTQRDSMREVYRLETPAMMQFMKIQSQTVQYESLTPIIQGLLTTFPLQLGSHSNPIYSAGQWYRNMKLRQVESTEEQKFYVDTQLAYYGVPQAEGKQIRDFDRRVQTLRDAIGTKQHNWDEVAAGFSEGRSTMRRVGDLLTFRGEAALERLRLINLQATEAERNKYLMRSMLLQ